jgi:hypothetical protein
VVSRFGLNQRRISEQHMTSLESLRQDIGTSWRVHGPPMHGGPIWPLFWPQCLNGWNLSVGELLEMCNSPINKRSVYERQPLLPPPLFFRVSQGLKVLSNKKCLYKTQYLEHVLFKIIKWSLIKDLLRYSIKEELEAHDWHSYFFSNMFVIPTASIVVDMTSQS